MASVIAFDGEFYAAYVQESALVKKGDPLVAVRIEQDAMNGDGADSAILKTLRRENFHLRSQIKLAADKANAVADQ